MTMTVGDLSARCWAERALAAALGVDIRVEDIFFFLSRPSLGSDHCGGGDRDYGDGDKGSITGN